MATTPAKNTETLTPEIVAPGTSVVPIADDGKILELVHADADWAGVTDVDLSPLPRRIAYLKVNRNLGEGFIDAETGEKTTSIDFVPVAQSVSRAWFKDAFGKGENAPSCRSANGVQADLASPDLQNGGDCATCPRARWTEDGKPDCRLSLEWLVALPDAVTMTPRLARLRWSGIAFRPAKDFWDAFDAVIGGPPRIAHLCHVDLVAATTDFGEKLAPVFRRERLIDRAAAQPIIEERDRRLADFQADVAADVAEGVDQRGEDDHGAGPFDSNAGEVPESERPF